MDICQFKTRLRRRKLGGWARNINSEIRKEKNRLMTIYDSLDMKYENGTLYDNERELMENTLTQLENIWKMEETKAR